MTNSVMQAILDRRSIRGYTNTQITESQRETLVQAALAAPTGMNRQAWHFSVVQNVALLNEISEAVRVRMVQSAPDAMKSRFEDPSYSVHYYAPTVIFISAPAGTAMDCGIAVQTIALAAQSMGLGSVILGMPREAFMSERGGEFEKRLQFPEGHTFQVAIAVGVPNTTKDAHEIGENKVSYIS